MTFGLKSYPDMGITLTHSGIGTREPLSDIIEAYALKRYGDKITDVQVIKSVEGDMVLRVRVKNKKNRPGMVTVTQMEIAGSKNTAISVIKDKLDELIRDLEDGGLGKLKTMAQKSKVKRGILTPFSEEK